MLNSLVERATDPGCTVLPIQLSMSTLDKAEKGEAHRSNPDVYKMFCIHHVKEHNDSGGEGTKLSIGAKFVALVKYSLFKIVSRVK